METLIKSRERVQQFGEVFTPNWMVKKMLAIPEIQAAIRDPASKFLEPCCGEGAFLTEILRQKLYFAPAKMFDALRSIFGIEIQLDNLQLAQKNLASIFVAHYQKFYAEKIPADLYVYMWNILSRNIFHGDVLKFRKSIGFDLEGKEVFVLSKNPLADALKAHFNLSDEEIKSMILVSNPPYHEDVDSGDNKTFAPPVYHKFLAEYHKTTDRVMVIHPARCLFDAGATPKDFNRKILSDPHIKVAIYEPDSSKVFPNAKVDIRGGVAVTYRDANKNFGAIETFIPWDELKSAHRKVVVDNKNFRPFSEIVYPRALYRLSANFPIADKINSSIGTNAFHTLSEYFFDEKPADGHEYTKILGRVGIERVYKFIRRDYIRDTENFCKYKVFIPSSNGSGTIGEKLATMLVGLPLVGCTETFTSAGAFDSAAEADNCLKYIKTKFARAMLGILKVTQHNPAETWRYVPLQEFGAGSDIDWRRSVHKIDKQLYRKYGLAAGEIEFIESKVKAME